MSGVPSLVRSVRQRLRQAGDDAKAPAMQAYMKTEQPFHGVQAQPRRRLVKAALAAFPVSSADEYRRVVESLWNGSHREEQYAAIDVAEHCRSFRTDQAWTLYERMLRSADNWDLVDPVATNLIGDLVRRNRVWEGRLRDWSSDEGVWLRRAALIAHLKHKHETNTELVAQTVATLASDSDFFVRKAIGWLLREYAKTDPDWVRAFVAEHEAQLSPLSRREALKNL